MLQGDTSQTGPALLLIRRLQVRVLPGARQTPSLHGCLRHRAPYDEQLAWPTVTAAAAA
jgi:hypothetical protein